MPIYSKLLSSTTLPHLFSKLKIIVDSNSLSPQIFRMSLERILEQNKNKDSGIRVPDNWEDFAYSSDKFAIPQQYKQYIDHVMLPRGLVMDRTEKMGKFNCMILD